MICSGFSRLSCLCLSLSIYMCVSVCVHTHAKLLQSFQLCVTLWTVAHQATLSMGFSRQEYWNGLLCPPPGDLPHPGTEPASLMSPALAGGFSTPSATCLCVLIPSSSFIPPQPYISPLVSISLCLKSVSLFLFCI